MDYRQELVTLAEEYQQHAGRSPARVATIILNQSNFFSRLEKGGRCSVDAYLKVKAWFSDNWPEATAWPEHIDRPVKQAA